MVKKIEAPAAGDGPGHVESLDALAREAASLQAEEPAGAASAGQAQQHAQQQHAQQSMADAVGQFAAVLRVGRDIAADFAHEAGVLPREKTLSIWSNDTIDKMAVPLLQLADKHGDQLGELMEKYGPHLALIGAALMPTLATIKAARAYKAMTVQARQVKQDGEGGAGG